MRKIFLFNIIIYSNKWIIILIKKILILNNSYKFYKEVDSYLNKSLFKSLIISLYLLLILLLFN